MMFVVSGRIEGGIRCAVDERRILQGLPMESSGEPDYKRETVRVGIARWVNYNTSLGAHV